MKKKSFLVVVLLALAVTISMSSDTPAKGKNNIADVHNNILIGEILPSGKVYLEWISLNGGYDNLQRFDGLQYQKKLRLYPLEKGDADHFDARFVKVIKDTYIGDVEKESGYYAHPFSRSRQDALVYRSDRKPGKATICFAVNNHAVERVTYFGKNEKRKYSKEEFRKAMDHVKRDNEAKEKHGSTLVNITKDDTILNATKKTLIVIKNVDYDILLSTYSTHGMEYASDVYVIDFMKNGKVVVTKEKWNTDGPY